MPRLTVLVADREREFAQALAVRFSQESSFNVLGSVYSSATTEAEVLRSHPDVLLLAESLDEDIAAVIARLRIGVEVQIVAMVCAEDPSRAYELVRAGACAVVFKDGDIKALIAAVEGAARHESHIPPRLLAGVLDELADGGRWVEQDERLARLTQPERDVLAYMMAGLARAGIAERMVLSTNTVRTHAQSLFAKLDVHSTLQAVSVALRAGFTDHPRPPEPTVGKRRPGDHSRDAHQLTGPAR